MTFLTNETGGTNQAGFSRPTKRKGIHAQRTGIKELRIKSGNLVVFVTSEIVY